MVLQSWLRGVRSCLFGSRRISRSAMRQQPVSPTATAVEKFEIRQYPAATLTATLNAGVLNIEGTSKADSITVQQTGDQLTVRSATATVQISVGASKVNQVTAAQVQRITINGLAGDDTIRLDGVMFGANINGGDGKDNIIGGNGYDTITGGLGNDVIDGVGGVNTLIESGNVNFVLTATKLTGSGTDTLSNITLAQITGGNGKNTIDASGFTGSVVLDGGDGDDTLIGGSSADVLKGGIGNDKITGNAGADLIVGGAGNDTLNGGAGDDTFMFSGSVQLGSDSIVVGDTVGTNTLDFSQLTVGLTRLDLGLTGTQAVNSILKLTLNQNNAISNVMGTSAGDVIIGNALDNVLLGRGGDDALVGNGGNNQLVGGIGRDTINGVIDPNDVPVTEPVTAQPAGNSPAVNLGARTHVFLVNGALDNGTGNNFDRDSNSYKPFLEQMGYDVHISDWDNLNTHEGHDPLTSDAQFVSDLAAKINQYPAADQVILIGHSYGGDSILKVANATSHRIDLLAALDPVGPQGFRSKIAKVGTDVSIIGGVVAGLSSGGLFGGLVGGLVGGLFGGAASNGAGAAGLVKADNLPTVPSNVRYFYNRWQTDGAFPVDFKTSGEIESRASASTRDDFGIVDQARDDVALKGFFGVAHMMVPNDPQVEQDIIQMIFSMSLVVTESDGSRTLVLPGTNGDDQYLLEGSRGTTTVTWFGHSQATVHNIDRVRFNGGDGNDVLKVGNTTRTLDRIIVDGLSQLASFPTMTTTFAVPIFAEGGAGKDFLMGGSANDTLIGGEGDDALVGQGGNDLLTGNDGRDVLLGDAGNDTLNGQAGSDQLAGGDGDDLLQGGTDGDVLDGQQGKDTLNGETGDDWLKGGDGNDLLNGGEDKDVLEGQDGEDSLNGDGGTDQLLGGNGDDLIAGHDGDDNLSGDAGRDTLLGGDGQDVLDGGDGEDSLRGGDGDDVLYGGRGDDSLNGDAGGDFIHGEAGQDVITLDVYAIGGEIDDFLSGGVDRDSLLIAPVAQAETGTGNNWLQVSQPSSSSFSVLQRDLTTSQIIASVTFNISIGTDIDLETVTIAGLDGNDRLEVGMDVGFNMILDGGDGNDTLIGGAGQDILKGQSGDDLLIGNGNNDNLHGDTGNDTLEAGDGADRLYGDNGDDQLNGGSGIDIQFGGAGRDLMMAGDGLQGDQIYGGDDNDTIFGGDGIDVASGQGGDDEIHGGKMSDILLGGDNNDTIYGDAGRDLIFGENGNDVLWASDGSPESNVTNPNWVVTYAMLIARENELTSTIIPQLEQKLHTTDSTTAEYTDLAQQLTDAGNELVTINDAEDSLNPYQNIKLDRLDGGDGNDELHGSTLNDFLFGGMGSDLFYHSAGQDVVIGGTDSNGKDTDTYLLDGTNGNDRIRIKAAPNPTTSNLEFDVEFVDFVSNAVLMSSHIQLDGDIEALGVRGLGGHDKMTASLGQNALKDIRFEGGDGNDTIDVSGLPSKATLLGGAGDDTLTGGLSDDLLVGGVLDINGNSVDADSGNDELHGGAGRDKLYGGDGSDKLFGDAENDTLDGGSGNDLLEGGNDNDSLFGNAGLDTLRGEKGDDTLEGGDGKDTLYGDAGRDTLSGGNGNDRLYADDEDGNLPDQGQQTLYGGEGNDTIYGGNGADRIEGGQGDDCLVGWPGNDTVIGQEGNDWIGGWAGDDMLIGDGQADSTFDGNDTIFGMDGDDFIHGGNGNDDINAGAGNDKVICAGGNDAVEAGSGNDEVYGGTGNDSLGGNEGTDSLMGEEGVDVLDGGGDSGAEADILDGGNGGVEADVAYYQYYDILRNVEIARRL